MSKTTPVVKSSSPKSLSEGFQFNRVQAGSISVVVVKGMLGGEFDWRNILAEIEGPVRIDLSEAYLNSAGTRSWVQSQDTIDCEIELHGVSCNMIDTFNLVQTCLNMATVSSFFVPFYCEDCQEEKQHLLRFEELTFEDGKPNLEELRCRCECGCEMVLDVEPESYFVFTQTQHARRLSKEGV